MGIVQRLVVNLFFATGLVCPAFAQPSCAVLGLSPDQVQDGQTYYKSSSGWQLFSGFSNVSIETAGRLSMAYVARESGGQERTGALVIKSGRTPPARMGPDHRVLLVRGDYSKYGACAKPQYFSDTEVSAYTYDRFHDFGQNRLPNDSLQTLRRFHIEFGSKCRRTDYDQGGPYRHVSNRASFSYTTDVVDTGGYTGVETLAARIGVGRAAAASSDSYLQRRTEIKQYSTVSGIACVPFTLPVSRQGSFLRINDLAAPIVNGRRELRYD